VVTLNPHDFGAVADAAASSQLSMVAAASGNDPCSPTRVESSPRSADL